MRDKRLAKSQLVVSLGVVLFCIGAIVAYEWWWAKLIFGVLGLYAAWLALVFLLFLAEPGEPQEETT